MSAQGLPAIIAGDVNLLRFADALARAGIVGRYDARRNVLVIQPANQQDAAPEICADTGRPPKSSVDSTGSASLRLVVNNTRGAP